MIDVNGQEIQSARNDDDVLVMRMMVNPFAGLTI